MISSHCISRSIILTLVALSLAIATAFFYLQMVSKQQIHHFSISHAKIYIATLTEVRSLYTSEVVARAQRYGMKISHDYQDHANAIPLPATFSMLFGNNLNLPGVHSKLYSAYPFPWREKTGGITDDFSQKAWDALNTNPTQDYYSFEVVDGVDSLRYASADIMRESCIDCHNSHPKTPYNQWKTGDLRGVLEITLPIEQTTNGISSLIRDTFVSLVIIVLFASLSIFVIVKNLKHKTLAAQRLKTQANQLNNQLQIEIQQSQQAQDKLRDISLTDELTGIANRRAFDQELEKQWQWSLRKNKAIAIIMFDIDYFKPYNDNYGHPKGDETLRRVAQSMASNQLRPFDTVCRYGGEEFVLILSETDKEKAMLVAERIRKAIEGLNITHNHSKVSNKITISCGVGVAIASKKSSPEALVKLADKSLYQAKHNGRNRTECGD